MYAPVERMFDDKSSRWTVNTEMNIFFLKSQERYCNDRLSVKGHLFLNEVFDMLGFPRTSEGAVVGWDITPEYGGSVKFNIPVEDTWIPKGKAFIKLTFNVDGIILPLEKEMQEVVAEVDFGFGKPQIAKVKMAYTEKSIPTHYHVVIKTDKVKSIDSIESYASAAIKKQQELVKQVCGLTGLGVYTQNSEWKTTLTDGGTVEVRECNDDRCCLYPDRRFPPTMKPNEKETLEDVYKKAVRENPNFVINGTFKASPLHWWYPEQKPNPGKGPKPKILVTGIDETTLRVWCDPKYDAEIKSIDGVFSVTDYREIFGYIYVKIDPRYEHKEIVRYILHM